MWQAKKLFWYRVAILTVAGALGVLSILPMIPQLIALGGESLPVPIWLVQTVSLLQSLVLLFAMVMLGAWLSPKVSLGTPIIDAWLQRLDVEPKAILFSALLWGAVSGLLIVLLTQILMPHLPEDFAQNAQQFSPAFYARILYGGITEEVLMRWGLMTFFVWICYRITQKKGSQIKGYNYLFGILLAALLFAAGHLPVASMLSSEFSNLLLLYIIVGNSLFGIIAGYLYWKQGLEAAIIAHMTAHIVMMLGEWVIT